MAASPKRWPAPRPHCGRTPTHSTSWPEPRARRGECRRAGLDTAGLSGLPEAIRRRVIRGWLLAGGASGLTDKQIRGVDALVTSWRGQGGVAVGSPLRHQRLIAGRRDGDADPAHRARLKHGTLCTWPSTPPSSIRVTSSRCCSPRSRSRRESAELGAQIAEDYRDAIDADNQDLLLVTVLKGAVFFVTDLARAIPLPTQLEFMAVSSYGSSTSSSGVVRILKDLDRDINERDVLIVEDIVDSGLTLSWLLRNLATRRPRSLRVCTLLRKPDAGASQRRHRLRRLRHPQRVRRRLRPGLRRALPRPALHRHAGPQGVRAAVSLRRHRIAVVKRCL